MIFSLPRGRVLPAALVAAVVAALALPAAARAQSPAAGDAVKVYVPTHGLDLAQANDLRRLRHRIEAAVDRICGDAFDPALDRRMLADTCRRRAARFAEPQVEALVRRDAEYAAARASARRAG
jgi:UrcA family protein